MEQERIAGQYHDSDKGIGVITQWVPSQGYETFIKHPKLQQGVLKSVERYGKDIILAKQRHSLWVERFKHPSKVTAYTHLTVCNVSYEMLCQRITLHALISILQCYSGDESILINTCAYGQTEELIIYIDDGDCSGSCIYDLSQNEAYCITANWEEMIEKAKKLIV